MVEQAEAPNPMAALEIENAVGEALSTIYDPEIPVDIQQLGLIYEILVDKAFAVTVRMTLTSPNCPAAQSLPAEVEQKVRAIDGVTDVVVEIVWEPPWTPERMSEAAKLELGLF